MHISEVHKEIVTKEYFVVVSEKGEYLRLNKNEDKIKIAEKTYQALKGTKAEMIKVYGNLVKDINDEYIELPYDGFKLGGILLIREAVTNEEWLTTSELDELLEQVDVKEGYEVSGQTIVSKSENKVEREFNLANRDLFRFLEDLDDTTIEEVEDIIFFTNNEEAEVIHFDDGTTFRVCNLCQEDITCKCGSCCGCHDGSIESDNTFLA